MSLLVLITSAAYTLFESSSASFKTSYNQVVSEGALHDLVIKENFQISTQDKVDLKIKSATGTHEDVDVLGVNKNKKLVSKSGSKETFTVDFVPEKSYSKYNLSENDLTIAQTFILDTNEAITTQLVNDLASKAKTVIESKLKEKLKDSFIDSLNEIYSNPNNAYASDVADFNEMSGLSVSAGVSAFKVIKYNPDTKVNKMNVYDGNDNFIPSLTDAEMLTALEQKSLDTPNTSKGYKITAQSALGDVYSVIDASAYQAIISPTFANQNNKSAISHQDFLSLVNQRFHDSRIPGSDFNFFDAIFEKVPELVQRYSNNIIWVDSLPYFITGVGVTPDFSYPIIDETHPTIDPKNQALVYVNSRGFERAIDSFRTNPRENYISVRFHDDVPQTRRSELKKEFEEFCKTGVSDAIIGHQVNAPLNMFTKDIAMVTDYDDPNDQMTLTQERVAFLSQLNNTITTISYITTTLLIVFVSIIVAMVFGVLITANRKSLSTLLAIGYSKTQIALSTATISLMIGAIPSIIGYLIGFSSHFLFIDEFDMFWTLPTYGHPFSFISLIITVVLPTFFLFGLIALVTYWTINHPIPDMLKDSVSDNSWIVAKIMSPFKGLGIKTKYAIALTLRNSGKVLLVSMTTIIASVALMVGISTIGQAANAYKSTVSTTNYEYKVDLLTPTTEGGQYSRVYYGQDKEGKYGYYINPDYASKAYNTETDEDKDEFADSYFNTKNTLASGATFSPNHMSAEDREIPHWHIPSDKDKPYALPSAVKLTASADLSETKTNIASYLKNDVQTKALINTNIVGGINPWATASQLMPENQQNTANTNYAKISQLAKERGIDISSPENFIKFINIPDIAATIKPYLLTYNTVMTNGDDETYTYIDSDIEVNGQSRNYHITGIQDDSAMYNISSKTIENMNNSFYNNPSFIPVAINKYAKENMNLSVGSIFSGVVKNDANRNFINHSKHEVDYVVVDIIDSYNDSGFITLQSIANRILGLKPESFNGVMSRHTDSVLLQSLPLYSPSGFYFATDLVSTGSIWEEWINEILKDPSMWKYSKVIAGTFDEFTDKYSNSPITSMLSKVEWQKMNQQTFQSVSKLTALLIDIIEGLSVVLSIVFTIIVISLIVRTNRKRIATLWTIGYRKKEIIRIFAVNLVPPLILAVTIATPVSIGLLTALQVFIMHFGHILIPFTLAFWVPLVVIASIAFVYIIATSLSIRALSSAGALEAFKED